ncbi:hypothetical protein [uncultured Polaribacter sp.]|uniref:nuclear transport factor 2 family protein n=1 Tax=uncultured Polaribacter sp. TaxID=174711 RepID=UPI002617D6E4|nr:hypothetical protein [uncultured Polaribacter sp.]
MKKLAIIVSVVILIASCGTQQKESKTKNVKKMESKKKLTNKEKSSALLKSLETGDKSTISFINPNKYKQHNLGVADGLEGFGAVLQNAPKGGFKAKVIRLFQDGDYTFSHTIYDFFGPKVGFDIFRYENGQIVEHWDNLSEITPVNPSNRTQTDGSTTLSDFDKTDQNKELIKDFVNTELINGNFDKMGNYFDGDTYIQHNSMIGDGLSGLGKALQEMAKNRITMIYEKNHIVLGEGNFVLSVSEGKFAEKHTSFYDLFRVKKGKIIEHWDVMETIAPTAEHKNSNGKFNF